MEINKAVVIRKVNKKSVKMLKSGNNVSKFYHYSERKIYNFTDYTFRIDFIIII